MTVEYSNEVKEALLAERKRLQRKQIRYFIKKDTLYYHDSCKIQLGTKELQVMDRFIQYLIQRYKESGENKVTVTYREIEEARIMCQKSNTHYPALIAPIFLKHKTTFKRKTFSRKIITNETFTMLVEELDRMKLEKNKK